MIRVDVTARQPLHLGVQPDAGWLTDTHRFVPGSVLRGALAASWLAANRGVSPDTTGDAEFQRIFEGTVRYGPLYPSENALRPLSVFGCKYASDAACQAVAHDVAFDGPAPARCPACGGPMVASKGAVYGTDVVGHTRVELDELERAKDGQLFTRRAVGRGATLTGLIAGDLDADLAWLAAGELPVRLGGRRSTSGLVTLRCRQEPSSASFTGWLPSVRRLVIRLLSPGIFVDALGCPSWLPDVREISEVLGVPAVIDAAFARPTSVSGWHAASNLPKPRDFAVAAGSVFVLRFDTVQPDHAALDRLWLAGLGLRRVEGNGWIDLQRWTPPPPPAVPRLPAPTMVDELYRDLIAYGVADVLVDDLRVSTQNRIVGSAHRETADAILAKVRYRGLTPAARDAFRRALGLQPEETDELARRLGQWVRTQTSRQGRRAP